MSKSIICLIFLTVAVSAKATVVVVAHPHHNQNYYYNYHFYYNRNYIGSGDPPYSGVPSSGSHNSVTVAPTGQNYYGGNLIGQTSNGYATINVTYKAAFVSEGTTVQHLNNNITFPTHTGSEVVSAITVANWSTPHTDANGNVSANVTITVYFNSSQFPSGQSSLNLSTQWAEYQHVVDYSHGVSTALSDAISSNPHPTDLALAASISADLGLAATSSRDSYDRQQPNGDPGDHQPNGTTHVPSDFTGYPSGWFN